MNPEFNPTNKSVKGDIQGSIPQELNGENHDGYMKGDLDDIDEISGWLSASLLEEKNHRSFSNFEIYDAIDGAKKTNREVSLVIAKKGSYPQHVHKDSDAFFIVVEGSALLESGNKKFIASRGAKIKIPRGTPHGFEIKGDEFIKFVSLQNPPIKNNETGAEDFHLYELV